MDEITAEQIANNYASMLNSAEIINSIIADEDIVIATTPANEEMGIEGQVITAKKWSYVNKTEMVAINVSSLEILVSQDYWTDEDMTAVNAAITAGKAYSA